jgi:hypothetical protein
MVYPADDLLLRARLIRRAAAERTKPTAELLSAMEGIAAELGERVRAGKEAVASDQAAASEYPANLPVRRHASRA